MNDDHQNDRPAWVKLALWGLPNRTAAVGFLWLSVALSAGCVAYGFVDRRYFIGAFMIIAALWYYLAIRWVDRQGHWP